MIVGVVMQIEPNEEAKRTSKKNDTHQYKKNRKVKRMEEDR